MRALTLIYWKLIQSIQTRWLRYGLYFLCSPLPLKCLPACLLTLLSFSLYANHLSGLSLVSAAIVGWFSAAFWLHYDDLWDQQVDQINHPQRPLASGAIHQRGAIVATLLAFLTANSAAWAMGYRAWGFTLFHLGLALIYPLLCRLQKVLANLVGAWTMLTPQVLFGPFIAASGWDAFCVFVLCLYPLSVGTQLQLDMADVKGDRELGLRTFVIMYGKDNTYTAILACIVVSCLVFFLFGISNLHTLAGFTIYVAIYSFALINLIYSNEQGDAHQDFLYQIEYASRGVILAVLLGLIAPMPWADRLLG
ncbi:hypothetical protein C7271_08405 [filamentous cyanobacterium CCP5]|nr:hypothetical protein C7271_08405 [filamentous cyanobacterium CCP5]